MTTTTPPRAARDPRDPRDGQDGATSAEYLTVMAVVALLVGTLIATGMVPPLNRAVEAAFCTIEAAIGTGCVPGDPVASDDAPPPDCTLTSSGEGIGGSVTVASVKIGGEGSYEILRRGDGTDDRYLVNLDINGSLGLDLITGGRIDLVDGLRTGRAAQLSASGELTYAPTFEFDSYEDAEAFAEQTRQLVTGPADDAFSWQTLVPVWGPGRIAKNQYDRVQDYDPPDPSATRIEGTVSVEGSGALYGGGGGGEVDAEVARSLGAVIDHDADETTLYFQVDADVAAEIGIGVPGVTADADGGLSSELVLGVTFDDQYSPSELQVGWTGQARGGVGLPSLDALWFADGASVPLDTGDALGIGLDVDEQDTWTLEATADLDLRDPRLGSIGDDVVDALLGGDPGGLVASGSDLLAHVRDESDLLVQYHTGDLSETGLEVAGGKVLAFGFGANYDSTSAALQDAWYRPGGFGWLDAVCGTT